MSYTDWIFALHLLTAATLVGGLVMSWIVVVALRSADIPDATLSLSRVETVGPAWSSWACSAQSARDLDGDLAPQLHPWHGWAIAAIVLWR